MINCSWRKGKTCRLLPRHGDLVEAVSAASLGSSFSQLARRTPEPCFHRVGALLEAGTWFWFSAALNECRAKLLVLMVQLQHLGRTKWQECWSLCGLSGTVLEIIYLLLSEVEPWCSPMCITAFLFIFCSVWHKGKTESVPSIVLPPGWKCHTTGAGACPEAGTEGSKSIQKTSGMTSFVLKAILCLYKFTFTEVVGAALQLQTCVHNPGNSSRLLPTLLVLTLWLTLPWSISNPSAALCLMPGCFLSPQLVLREKLPTQQMSAVFFAGEEHVTWSQSKFCITILSLLWDEKDGILCCFGGMAGFVVQWIMKGSCPFSRCTLLCGWGKAWLWESNRYTPGQKLIDPSDWICNFTRRCCRCLNVYPGMELQGVRPLPGIKLLSHKLPWSQILLSGAENMS